MRLLPWVALGLVAIAAAQSVREITWADLAPKRKPDTRSGLDKLNPRDHADLVAVARVQDQERKGGKPPASQREAARKARAALLARKVDPDRLLAERDRIIRERTAYATWVDKGLEGTTIRMSGYLLPLEFEGTRVTEFLLVPWVGACIHTPPPAPNQIVYVKASSAVETSGKFDPVTVTGRMAAKASVRELFLVDGSDFIDVGYSLQATQVRVSR